MSNEVEITITAEEDASRALDDVADAATRTSNVVVRSMGDAEDAFDTALRESGSLGAGLERLEGGAGAVADGMDGISQATQSVADIMSYADRRASDLARAQLDVDQAANDAAQAIEDLHQAERDGAQATIDAEQAHIDQAQALIDEKTALAEYNKLVKEGKGNTTEATQALNDIKQARLDGRQATEDLAQAERDSKQAALDQKQAAIDQKSATQDLTDAQRELANQQGVMQQVTEWTGMLSGLLGGLVGVIGLVSAAQWAWNLAMTANPIGLVVVAVAALIAIIVVIATKTTWFQTLWNATWGKIGGPVKSAWKWIKDTTSSFMDWIRKVPKWIGDAFSKVTNFITAPFRAAFNGISRAWNNTVGGFGFSVPSWIPGVGGQSFSIPNMPSLAVGGDVMKSGLAYIHAGERIQTAARVQRLPYDAAPNMSTPMDVKVSVEILGGADDALTAALLDLLENNVRVSATINKNIRETVKNNGNGSVQTAYGRRGAS